MTDAEPDGPVRSQSPAGFTVTPSGIALQAMTFALYAESDERRDSLAYDHFKEPGEPVFADPTEWRALDWDALAAAGATARWTRHQAARAVAGEAHGNRRMAAKVNTEPVKSNQTRLFFNVLAGLWAVARGLTPDEVDRLAKHGLPAKILGLPTILPSYLGANKVVRIRMMLRAFDELVAVRNPSVRVEDFYDQNERAFALALVEVRDPWFPAGAYAGWALTFGWKIDFFGDSKVRAREIDGFVASVREWSGAVGPDGWAWAAAGFTLAETRVLIALPETHPARPGPEQLAVMAALRADV